MEAHHAQEGPVAADTTVVGRLPAPPNARADGLDARAASLVAFLVDEVQAPAPGGQPRGQAAQILVAARARPVPARAGVPLWQVVTGAVGDVASVLTPALTLLLAVLVMTGVLTFIADAVASR